MENKARKQLYLELKANSILDLLINGSSKERIERHAKENAEKLLEHDKANKN